MGAWHQVYVHPERRGAGLGTAMTRAAIAAAGDVRDLWIVADDEDRPKHLYARLGFRPARTMMVIRIVPESPAWPPLAMSTFSEPVVGLEWLGREARRRVGRGAQWRPSKGTIRPYPGAQAIHGPDHRAAFMPRTTNGPAGPLVT